MKALTENEKQALKEVIEYWEAHVNDNIWQLQDANSEEDNFLWHDDLIDKAFRKLGISKS